ncbi:hypothetical protein QQF64_036191 [Cirrhinus molitorella]|uniref:Sodium-dependent multivitamin transporter n=1 Tax=Cirrhinus molitorella TaxID=172907 RepID=A0ABR3NHW8_9TELE
MDPAGHKYFTVTDYVIFALLLVASTAIGLYYAFKGRQRTAEEFLYADRSMKCLPLALSLMASFQSAVAIIGTPAEVYANGTQYWFIGCSYILGLLIPAHIFIPVFYRLQLKSVYQYLELRFCKAVRICGTAAFIFQMVIYMGVSIYTPALALNAVTGFHLWGAVLAIGLVCTLNTALGGLKAVVWTNVFQTVVMFTGQLVIIILGVHEAGGLSEAWAKVRDGGRISGIDLNPDPTVRHTFWTLGVGGVFLMLSLYGVNQAQVQRYLSSRSEREAKMSCYMVFPCLQVSLMLSCVMGLVMYAYYGDNSPLEQQYVTSKDQMVLFFVMDTLQNFPGIPGLFVACLFSTSLGTVSSAFNSLATVTMVDLIEPHYSMTEARATLLSKMLAVSIWDYMSGYGLCHPFDEEFSFTGSSQYLRDGWWATAGFVLSRHLFPCANSIGAVTGLASGLVMSFWVGIGGFLSGMASSVQVLPLNSTNTVPDVFENITAAPAIVDAARPKGLNGLYSLSYMWYSALNSFIVVLVGLIISFLTGPTKGDDVSSGTVYPVMTTARSLLHKLVKPGACCLDPPEHLIEIHEMTGNVEEDTDTEEDTEVFLQSNPESHMEQDTNV